MPYTAKGNLKTTELEKVSAAYERRPIAPEGLIGPMAQPLPAESFNPTF